MSALPEDFDLAAPVEDGPRIMLEKVERLTDLLFSALHLRAIFLDPAALLRFTSFLAAHRPQSLPTLVYYLDATKALNAIAYANAVARGLEPVLDPDEEAPGGDEASKPLAPIAEGTVNRELQVQADRAFALLVRLDLPAYTAFLFTQVIKSRMVIPLNRAPKSEETFQGFAEVFCLTDPRRPDNPIIFASPGSCAPPVFAGSVDELIAACLPSFPPNDAVQHELHHRPQLPLPPGPAHEPRQPGAHPQGPGEPSPALGSLCQLVRPPHPTTLMAHC